MSQSEIAIESSLPSLIEYLNRTSLHSSSSDEQQQVLNGQELKGRGRIDESDLSQKGGREGGSGSEGFCSRRARRGVRLQPSQSSEEKDDDDGDDDVLLDVIKIVATRT